MGLTIVHIIFPDISHNQTECGKYLGLIHGISLVPHNIIVMDMKNVMKIVVIIAC